MEQEYQDVLSFAKKIWHSYLIDRNYTSILSYFDESLSWVGTDRGEFFPFPKEALAAACSKAGKDAKCLEILRERYHPICLADGLWLVVGFIIACTPACEDLMFFPVRFTTIIRRDRISGFKIIHFHTSVPSDSQENAALVPSGMTQHSYDVLADRMSKQTELEALANSISGGVARFRLDEHAFVLLYANKGFFRLCGNISAPEDHPAEPIYMEQFIHPNDYQELVDALSKTVDTNDVVSQEIRILRQDGSVVWVYVRATFVEMQDEHPVFQGIFVDLTEQKKAQKNLERTNRELKQLTDSIPGGVATVLMDETLSLSYANDAFYRFLRLSPENGQQETLHLSQIVHPEDLPGLKALLNEKATCNEMAHMEYRIQTVDGKTIWVAFNASKIDDHDGVSVMLCVFMDITKLKSIQQALEMEKERYRIVAGFSKDLLFEYDIELDSLYFFNSENEVHRFDHRFSSFRDTMVEQKKILPEDLPVFNQMCDQMESGISEFTFELRCCILSKHYAWTRIQGKTICNEENIPMKVIGRLTNIDEQKREIEGLIEKAQFDTLTGLYNRGTTEMLIQKAILQGNNRQHAFIIADLDRFKNINDTLGHMIGDNVLTEVSSQLRSIMRDSDIVGRMGGDEFIIFLKNIGSSQAIRRKAKEICNIFRKTYVGRNNQPISGSVGVALYPHDGKTFDELFAKADIALYGAKRRGKDRYMLYSSDIEPIGSVSKPMTQPLQGEDFKLALQELVNSAADPEYSIEQLLAEAGALVPLSRAAIIEPTTSSSFIHVTYEWCNTDAPSALGSVHNISLSDWQNDFLYNFKNKTLICMDTQLVQMAKSIRAIYTQFGTRAQIQYLIGDPALPQGSICFDICDRVHEWSYEEIDALLGLAKTIGMRLLDLRASEQLSGRNLLFEAAVHNPNLFAYAVRPDTHKLLFIDPSMQKFYPDAKPGDLCYKAFHFGSSPCLNCPMSAENGGISEFYNSHLGWWVNATASQVPINYNEEAVVICFSNITSFRRRIMTTDSLTGLSNLTEFETDALSLLNNRGLQNYALAYLDFNKFKYINEACGYYTGDQVLITFARILLSKLHTNELACRYASDKFITLFEYERKEELIQRLIELEQTLKEGVKDITQGLNVSLTGGIYCIEPDSTDDFITIVDRANIARKSIKGKDIKHFATYDRMLHQKVTREKEIELLMADALKNKEFVVFLQPKVDLKTGKIAGAEALVRWFRNYGQTIMPSEFIPIFEKNSFIKQLDYYIHDQVFRLLRKCLDEGKPLVPISINISRIDILDERFLTLFEKTLKKYELPPELIELELTESVFLDSTDTLIDSINRLRSLGLLFSIDDFGSGYSSLNLLRRLPIDVLKLDREFLSSKQVTKREQAVIAGMIHLAKSLDIVVLSEGVETAEQAEFLKSAGCDLAQGYLYSKPIPIDAFLNKLAMQS